VAGNQAKRHPAALKNIGGSRNRRGGGGQLCLISLGNISTGETAASAISRNYGIWRAGGGGLPGRGGSQW